MGLETYQRMRDFRRTPEPKGKVARVNRWRFVVQEHHASMLHFDFRLEMGGVLKSWSVRRGPSLDPAEKRLAVETEDHPVEYLKFEGHIPEGNYGAGEHMIWDEGRYELVEGDDALEQFSKGRLKFVLHGKKLRGEFNLVRFGGREGQWLLIKGRDEFAQAGWELELRMPEAGGAKKISNKQRARGAEGKKEEKKEEKTGKKPVKKHDESKAVAASRVFGEKELSGDARVKVGVAAVSLTNLSKIYWPGEGYTKGDLVRYYYEVSKLILPYLKDRPLIMKRYPNGVEGPFFHQHDVDDAPDFVRTETLEVEGHTVDYVIGDNLPTLLYMANLGAIERHPWHSRVANLDKPDWLVFDLDPGKGVEFETICELAVVVREALEGVGLASYPKTSGSRGVHVYVPVKPVYDYELVAEFAELLATRVADQRPEVATVERSLKKRKRGQIYVDHMQNARGKSVVAPYSVRPRAGAPVSAPLEWREVERAKIRPQDFTIKNILRRVEKRGDLFTPVLRGGQNLAEALEKLKGSLDERKAKRAKA